MDRRLVRTSGIVVAGLGAALGAATLAAQETVPSTDPRIEAVEHGLTPRFQVEGRLRGPFSLGERMRHYGVPGVSVAVVDGGRVAWARGYGVEEVGTDRRVTAATLFQAASISKPVAALGALRLVERGDLALDEEVNGRLRSWRVPPSDALAGEPVTLRRLLTHSAGLTVHGFRGYASDEPVPATVEVLAGSGPSNSAPVVVDLAPGTEWRYSGGGYTVAQLLMEEVGGQPFPALMRALVLEPLGMRQSTYDQPLPLGLRPHAATGHRPDGQPVPGRYHTYPEMAAAGLWTTPADLARYIIGVQRARAGEEGAVLDAELAEAMLTPAIGDWGLGPQLDGEGSLVRFQHGGSNQGFRAFFLGFAERGQGVAVMTNSDAGSPLAQEIVLAVARVYGWPEVEPRVITPLAVESGELERYAGTYRAPERTDLTVRAEVRDGVLYMHLPGADGPTELIPVEPDVFLMLELGQRVVFERDDTGRIVGISSPVRLVRIDGS